MAIDVGTSCLYRGNSITGVPRTVVSKDNPANATGTIDYVCLAAISYNLTGIECASFSAVGDVLTTNASVALADATKGVTTEYNAPGDFTAFNINSGEYLGYAYTGGRANKDNAGGAGIWSLQSDEVPCTDVSFDIQDADGALTLYGTGTESGGRTTKNTDPWNLGVQHGMGFRML